MKKYNHLIKQKNFLAAGLLLRDNSLLSDLFETGKSRDILSAPAYKIQDLSKYHTLERLTGKKSRPQTERDRRHFIQEPVALYRVSNASNGAIEITPHVTLSKLCDDLKNKGLGDPRDQIKPRPPDPLPLLRRRKRQEKKYPFYKEKLRGCALQDMEVTNSKATAFIEQQKEGQLRTVSANWRERYNKMQAFDKVSQDSDSSLDDDHQFAAWDEDRKPHQLDEQSHKMIEIWLDKVQEALFPTPEK